METYQTPSIESFSYSWLANMNTSFQSPGRSFGDSLDAYDKASFIEMDPQLSSSKRLFKVSQDFDFPMPEDFDFPMTEAPMGLVDADKLILNGFIVPVFVNQVKADAYDASKDPIPSSASASSSSKKLRSVSDSGNRTRCSSLKKCRKLSRQIFLKYLDLFKPLCQRGSRVGTFTARLHGERNWETAWRKKLGLFSFNISASKGCKLK
ncbi:probable membrane-associated kinase regulator 6 [Daucus carota subsp. sativus]|uniref:probable membrane-associated kinase regulator 6 n=1 Tax=Daucus carota subsp. sativus TaxID=79200 RepID=UPI0007EF45D4|nr:PREDICTED: probable membrane-associated kinase regulator 6 [Daucus carota subsp. sativus]